MDTRRTFLRRGAYFLLGILGGAGALFSLVKNKTRAVSSPIRSPRDPLLEKHKIGRVVPRVQTKYFTKLKEKKIRCRTCFRTCVVSEGNRGFCRSRINVDGLYYTLTYGRPSALQIDPVEKEPSYHFLPGMSIFCTGTACCTNRCKFCHNWHLSQTDIYDIGYWDLPAKEIVRIAKSNGSDALSFTYNEPTVFFEYMLDIMVAGKEEGLKLLFHTNGGMAKEPLSDLLAVTDAVTVDLKGFTETFYKNVSSSRLSPVQDTLRRIRATDVHLEIVNLVVPSLNDNLQDIERMCRFIKDELGDTTPLHFTRFFPSYKLTHLPPTPISTLEEARAVAVDKVGLKFVYIGNVPGHKYNSTFCPGCGKALIERTHFEVHSNIIRAGKCPNCHIEIPGIWRKS
jgi:pyruvate formate lyase activating enzyme